METYVVLEQQQHSQAIALWTYMREFVAQEQQLLKTANNKKTTLLYELSLYYLLEFDALIK